MKAIFYSKERQELIQRELQTPAPREKEVLIKTNFLVLTQRDLKNVDSENDIIPGRFFVGEVIAAGSDVKDFAPGETVSGITSFFCGSCEACKNLEYHLCENPSIPGKDVNGFFAEYITIKSDFLFKVPPEIPKEKAIFLPLIAELLAYIPEEIKPGSTGIITAGSIEDLLFNNLLLISGFVETAILSTSTRLRTFLKPDLRTHYMEEPTGLLQFFEGYGEKPDYAFDLTGNLPLLKSILQVLKPNATLFLAEKLLNEDKENIAQIWKFNIRMKNLLPIEYRISYAIKILQTHAIQPDDFITHIFNLDDYQKISKILLQEPSLIRVKM
uniref:Alcohol dehydrogenase-like N-terminal domain-containing protein n=1 Tax=candidate division WOR-3 bacterium TaxID=2052148 RepID=A0A7V4E427_UNCW3